MPDINDELDALFDDDEPQGTEDENAEGAEDGQDEKEKQDEPKSKGTGKLAAKKRAALGARANAAAMAKKVGTRSLPRSQATAAKAKTPEPSEAPSPEETSSHAVRPKVVHAQSEGGGKGLLLVSLVLNVVLVLFAIILLAKLGATTKDVAELKVGLTAARNDIISTLGASRMKMGVYVDAGSQEKAVIFALPPEIGDIPKKARAVRVPLENLLNNASKGSD